MANAKYNAGRNFEYKIRLDLTQKGFFCVRSAGSKGPVDIVAMKPQELLLIQAKINGILPREEWNILFLLARQVAGIPILAQKDDTRGSQPQFFQLMETRDGRGGAQPMIPYIIDQPVKPCVPVIPPPYVAEG